MNDDAWVLIPLEKITALDRGKVSLDYERQRLREHKDRGLLEHIITHGLDAPIRVYKNTDETYEIIDGVRRYLVYEILNEDYPGKGWDKIPAIISDGGVGGHRVAPTIEAE